MGRRTWSVDFSAEVAAGADRVIAWWFHPDRKQEFLARIAPDGAVDLEASQSMTDGLRVRTVAFEDRAGWSHHHRLEARLAPDGRPTPGGGGFLVPSRDVNEMRSPRGEVITLHCEGTLEFVPRRPASTEVRIGHTHTLAGGTWRRRWSIRRSDPVKMARQFRSLIADCSGALESH